LASKNIVAKELLQKISIVDGFTSAGSNRRNYDQKEHVRLLVELFDFTVQNINSNCSKIIQARFIEEFSEEIQK
jgi:hypothetical protein